MTFSSSGSGNSKPTSVNFVVNPSTGSGFYGVPLKVSPARDLTPELVLSYSTERGNGLFGFGYDLPVARIFRSTLHGVPRYNDDHVEIGSKDTFVLSGDEELVEISVELSPDSQWTISRYHPRVLDKVKQIEFWRHRTNRALNYWIIREPHGVNHVFGQPAFDANGNITSDDARIIDPSDPTKTHVFGWLIKKSFDAKGNEIIYSYTQDERNANQYLKSIRYGNYHLIDLTNEIESTNEEKKRDDASHSSSNQYAFEVVLDYGEYSTDSLKKGDVLPPSALMEQTGHFEARPDHFVSYRAGFSVKTERRCKNILLFHRLKKEFNDKPFLVKRWELNYKTDDATGLSLLNSIQEHGYRTLQSGRCLTKSRPKVELTYTNFSLEDKFNGNRLRFPEDAPAPTSSGRYQFIDLFRESLPGILYSQPSATYYCRNQGDGSFSKPFVLPQFPLEGNINLFRQPLMDIPGTDQLAFIVNDSNSGGFYEALEDIEWDNTSTASSYDAPTEILWKDFQAFESYPVDAAHPRAELLDINGSGMNDIINLGVENPFFYPSLGKKGFDAAKFLTYPDDFPTRESNPCQLVTFANMVGDGLMHRVKIDDKTIDYWPNLGHGRFGEKISIPSPFKLPSDEIFDASRVLLANVKGTGGTDILYLNETGIDVYINHQGQSFTKYPKSIIFPTADNTYTPYDRIRIADLFGKGASTLIFSKAGTTWQHYYYDFAPDQKPYLLKAIANSCGATTEVVYSYSTRTYVEDNNIPKQLPTRRSAVPVTIVEKITTKDQVAQLTFVERYKFHDGYYDPVERDFLGFGFVESWDGEEVKESANLDTPLAYTKQWYANKLLLADKTTQVDGATPSENPSILRLTHSYSSQFYQGDKENTNESNLAAGLLTIKSDDLGIYQTRLKDPQADNLLYRQANYALKGKLLRQEVYGLTKDDAQDHPYTVVDYHFNVGYRQFPSEAQHGIFTARFREAITFTYERNSADPRITQLFCLEWDDYSHLLKSVLIHYPRRQQTISLPLAKKLADAKDSESEWLAKANTAYQEKAYPDQQTLRMIGETRQYRDIQQNSEFLFADSVLCEYRIDLSSEADKITRYSFDEMNALFTPDTVQEYKNVLSAKKYYYREEVTQLPLLKYTETLVETQDTFYTLLLTYNNRLSENKSELTPASKEALDTQLKKAGYLLKEDGSWWQPSPIISYTGCFYLPLSVTSFMDKKQNPERWSKVDIVYDHYHLFTVKQLHSLYHPVEKVLKSIPIVMQTIDYHILRADTTTDANGTTQQVLFDPIGVVVASSIYGKVKDKQVGNMPLSEDLLEGMMKETSLVAILENPSHYLSQAGAVNFYNTDVTPNWHLSITQDCFQIAPMLLDSSETTQPSVSLLLSYRDGLGDVIQKKAYKGDNHWQVSGYTQYNNKGLKVEQYLPCDSDNYSFEDKNKLIKRLPPVKPVMTEYDALNRPTKVTDPQDFHTLKITTPWYEIDFDKNDTNKISSHYNTPDITFFDTQMNAFLSMEVDRYQREDQTEFKILMTRTTFDPQGQPLTLQDPRLLRPNMIYHYDKLGQIVLQESVDSGLKFNLYHCEGQLLQQSDSRNQAFTFEYDNWRRLLKSSVQVAQGSLRVYEKREYGEFREDADTNNLYGKLVKCYDAVGITYFSAYDIQGNLLESTRRLSQVAGKSRDDLLKPLDWEALESDDQAEGFTTYSCFNTFNQLVQQQRVEKKNQDNENQPVLKWQYNTLNQLQSIDLNKAGKSRVSIVEDIRYMPVGERASITYGNQVTTAYTYEDKTQRLEKFETTHPKSKKAFQSIGYEYDGIGNITRIDDKTYECLIQTESSLLVQPSPVVESKLAIESPPNQYDYDSLYRLRHATGKEFSKKEIKPTAGSTSAILSVLQSEKPKSYEESYDYDEGNNAVKRKHKPTEEKKNEGTDYTINDDNNRLAQSTNQAKQTLSYTHDATGNLNKITEVKTEAEQSILTWNEFNQLTSVKSREKGVEEYYFYDASGRRARKLSVQKDGSVTEKLYLGNYNITRTWKSSATASTFKIDKLEENSTQIALRVKDDQGCIATYQTKDSENSPVQDKLTYHHKNHLGSIVVELSDDPEKPEVLTYEEYLPYGDTSFIAASDEESLKAKAYRYSGKERDDTGMYYYGARYYSPELERWVSTDPAGFIDGLNVYGFVRNNPITFFDMMGMALSDEESWKRKSAETESEKEEESGGEDIRDKKKIRLMHSAEINLSSDAETNKNYTIKIDLTGTDKNPWEPLQEKLRNSKEPKINNAHLIHGEVEFYGLGFGNQKLGLVTGNLLLKPNNSDIPNVQLEFNGVNVGDGQMYSSFDHDKFKPVPVKSKSKIAQPKIPSKWKEKGYFDSLGIGNSNSYDSIFDSILNQSFFSKDLDFAKKSLTRAMHGMTCKSMEEGYKNLPTVKHVLINMISESMRSYSAPLVGFLVLRTARHMLKDKAFDINRLSDVNRGNEVANLIKATIYGPEGGATKIREFGDDLRSYHDKYNAYCGSKQNPNGKPEDKVYQYQIDNLSPILLKYKAFTGYISSYMIHKFDNKYKAGLSQEMKEKYKDSGNDVKLALAFHRFYRNFVSGEKGEKTGMLKTLR